MKPTTGLQWLWRMHRGKVVGAVVGVLIALLIKWVGWWWALLILIFAVAGAFVGAALVDRRVDVDVVDE